MMNDVLQQAGVECSAITQVAFANGPGAFTGVRIAAATAQGLSLGLHCPIVAISSLAVLAQQAADLHQQNRVLAAIDARMGEAYVGLYQRPDDSSVVRLAAPEQLVKLADMALPEDYLLAGTGYAARRQAGFEVPAAKLDDQVLPHAAALARLAADALQRNECIDSTQVPINYLRNQVAEKSRKKVL